MKGCLARREQVGFEGLSCGQRIGVAGFNGLGYGRGPSAVGDVAGKGGAEVKDAGAEFHLELLFCKLPVDSRESDFEPVCVEVYGAELYRLATEAYALDI